MTIIKILTVLLLFVSTCSIAQVHSNMVWSASSISASSMTTQHNSRRDTIIEYFADGIVRKRYCTTTDDSSGFADVFYPGGIIRSHLIQHDLANAYIIYYHENGNKKSEGSLHYPLFDHVGDSFYNGPVEVKSGIWSYYNKKGKLISSDTLP